MRRIARWRYRLGCWVVQWAYDRLEEESRWYWPAYRLANWILPDDATCEALLWSELDA